MKERRLDEQRILQVCVCVCQALFWCTSGDWQALFSVPLVIGKHCFGVPLVIDKHCLVYLW